MILNYYRKESSKASFVSANIYRFFFLDASRQAVGDSAGLDKVVFSQA